MTQPNTIDYYYAPVSGYAYLGEPRLMQIAAKYEVEIRFKPVDILRVFAEAGTTPPPKQPRSRLDYRLLDLKRTANYLNLPINPRPRHWPVPVELAARSIYAAIELGLEPHSLSFAILSAVYAQEKDVSDEDVIDNIFTELALNKSDMWQLTRGNSTQNALEEATQEAISLGIFG